MSYSIRTIAYFDKQFKRLSKKYPSLKNDFVDFINQTQSNPESGTALGDNCYKFRLAIKSKNKGKSGGARIITYVAIYHETVFLLSIYDKSEQTDISDADLLRLVKIARQ